MAEVVADVGQIRHAGLKGFDDDECLGDGGVGGMGLVAESVEEENLNALEEGQRFIGDFAVIGEVGEFADAEAIDRHGAMEKGDGDYFLFVEVEGFTGDYFGLEFGAAGFVAGVGEDVFEDAADDVEGGLAAVDGDVAGLAEVEGADVVETENVVGVAVGEEDGVELGDADAEGLITEVGGGVDDDVFVVVVEPDGGAEAVVARVV